MNSLKKWLALFSTGIAIMIINLDLTIVNLGLPRIAHELHAALPEMQWVMSGYLLAASVSFMLFGKLADKYGIRFIFIIGECIFTLSSLVAGASHSIEMLILARLLQGLGFAATLGLSLIIIIRAFPASQKGLASGMAITITGVSQAIGPTIGGVILSYFSWRWMFLINIPLGLIAIIGTLIFTPKDSHKNSTMKVDYRAVLNLVVAIGLTVFAINEITQLSTWLTIGLLLTGSILLIIFFVHCKHAKHPLIPRIILQNKRYVKIVLTRMCFMFYMMSMLFIIPIYLINIIGLSPMHTGLLLLMMTALAMVTSPICGGLIDRIDYHYPLRLSFIAAALGSVCLFFTANHLNYWIIIPGLMLYGVAVGLHIASSIHGALAETEQQHHGIATGIFFTFGMLGGAIGVSLLGSIINIMSKNYLLHHISAGLQDNVLTKLIKVSKGTLTSHSLSGNYKLLAQQSFLSGFHMAFYILCLLMVIAFLISTRINRA